MKNVTSIVAHHPNRLTEGLLRQIAKAGKDVAQCLARRIPDKQILIDEIAAWEDDRNANYTKADWQFSTKDARVKLKHLYPAI